MTDHEHEGHEEATHAIEEAEEATQDAAESVAEAAHDTAEAAGHAVNEGTRDALATLAESMRGIETGLGEIKNTLAGLVHGAAHVAEEVAETPAEVAGDAATVIGSETPAAEEPATPKRRRRHIGKHGHRYA